MILLFWVLSFSEIAQFGKRWRNSDYCLSLIHNSDVSQVSQSILYKNQILGTEALNN